MSEFVKSLVTHLARELDVSEKNIEKALNSFYSSPKKESSEKKVESPKSSSPKKSPKNSEDENSDFSFKIISKRSLQGKCCRKKKSGICGTGARYKVKRKGAKEWYCTACFKIVQKNHARSKLSSSISPSNNKGVGKNSDQKPTDVRKKQKDILAKALVGKIVKQGKIRTQKIKIGNNIVWVDEKSGIVFNSLKQATGMLSEDRKSIVEEFTDKAQRYIEANNIRVKKKVEIDDSSSFSSEEENKEEKSEESESFSSFESSEESG